MKAMAFGTFSIIHPGHILFLEKAKALADELIVVIARDSRVKQIKGYCILPAEQRRQVVQALKPVDRAILGNEGEDIFKIVVQENPDVVVLGPDQEYSEKDLQVEFEKRGIHPKIVRIKDLSAGEYHKSGKIVDRIKSLP